MPLIQFVNDYEKNSTQAQAGYLRTVMLQKIQEGLNVGIVYAANDKQVKNIRKGYFKGVSPNIEGHRQAEVFHLVSHYINSLDLADRIHILPIATSLTGGEDKGDNCVEKKHIMRDLQNINNHLKAGWTVFVLTNPDHLKMNKKYGFSQKYQIGGGASKNFYSKNYLSLALPNGENVSPGHFIEVMLDNMRVAYMNTNSLTPENTLHAQNLVDEKFPANQWVTFSIKHYLFQALTANHLKLNSEDIISVKFGQNADLLIICKTDAVLNNISKKLNCYGVHVLNKVGEKAQEKPMLSIDYSRVVSLMNDYCRLPMNIIASYYENEIMRRNEKYESVAILASIIFINKKPYSLEECIRQQVFHSFTQRLKSQFCKATLFKNDDQNELNNIVLALKEIMAGLSSDEKKSKYENQSFEYVTPLWLSPLGEIDSNEHENISLLLSFLKELKEKKYGDPVKFRSLLMSCLRFYYFSMAIPIYQAFNKITFEDCASKSLAIINIMNFSSKISAFVRTDILKETLIENRAFKIWFYIQVSLRAFLDGNHFLFFALMYGVEPIFRQLNLCRRILPETAKTLFEFLWNKRANQTLMNLSLNYKGVCVPEVSAFCAWIDRGENVGQEAKTIEEVRVRLSPILDRLRSYMPPILSDNSILDNIYAQECYDVTLLLREASAYENEVLEENLSSYDQIQKIFGFLERYSLHYDLLNTYCQVVDNAGLGCVRTDYSKNMAELLDHQKNLFSSKDVFIILLKKEHWELIEKLLFYKLVYIDSFSFNQGVIVSNIENMSVVSQLKAKSILHRYVSFSLESSLSSSVLGSSCLSSGSISTSDSPAAIAAAAGSMGSVAFFGRVSSDQAARGDVDHNINISAAGLAASSYYGSQAPK